MRPSPSGRRYGFGVGRTRSTSLSDAKTVVSWARTAVTAAPRSGISRSTALPGGRTRRRTARRAGRARSRARACTPRPGASSGSSAASSAVVGGDLVGLVVDDHEAVGVSTSRSMKPSTSTPSTGAATGTSRQHRAARRGRRCARSAPPARSRRARGSRPRGPGRPRPAPGRAPSPRARRRWRGRPSGAPRARPVRPRCRRARAATAVTRSSSVSPFSSAGSATSAASRVQGRWRPRRARGERPRICSSRAAIHASRSRRAVALVVGGRLARGSGPRRSHPRLGARGLAASTTWFARHSLAVAVVQAHDEVVARRAWPRRRAGGSARRRPRPRLGAAAGRSNPGLV